MLINKWDKRFLEMANLISLWSKDPSTGTGCVITKENKIISLGFNGYPKGIKDNSKDPRNLKLSKTIHAEANAILFASKNLENCTLYVTPIPPCDRCGSLIVQSGIKRVVIGLQQNLDITRWNQSTEIAQDMFIEAGVEVNRIYLK